MHLVLERFCHGPDGVFGILHAQGVQLFTVERPWLENRRGISCIPAGRYQCGPRHYHRGGYAAVEVMDVPNRSHILFHVANTPSDVQGCIGVGFRLGCVKGQWAVLKSRKAFDFFMESVGDGVFGLEIVGVPPNRSKSIEV